MSQSPELYNRMNYLADINYLIDNRIYEYDISKANISALRAMNSLTDEDYNNFLRMPKMDREIIVGKMELRDNTLYNKIKEGISLSKKAFVEQNKIDDINILRIANDSIYTYNIKESINLTVIVNNIPITFVEKNKFTSFVNLNSILVFFSQNADNWNIDVKGINQNKLIFHEKFLSFICTIIQYLEVGQSSIAFREFNKFYNDYISFNLSKEYYREFNDSSLFRIKGMTGYGLLDINQVPINEIDIGYNLYLLRLIYSIIVGYSYKS